MEKLSFLKKMYINGKLEGEFDGEVVKFESLEALKTEIKATMKRMQEIEELEYEDHEECKEDCCKEENSKDNLDDLLEKRGWKIYRMKWPTDPFFDMFNDWPWPRRRYRL